MLSAPAVENLLRDKTPLVLDHVSTFRIFGTFVECRPQPLHPSCPLTYFREQALARIVDLGYFAGLFIGKYALGRAPTGHS